MGSYIFDDAETFLNSTSRAAVGSYKPHSGELLSDFNGEDATGLWTFNVFDDAGSDIGTLDFWELMFTFENIGSPPSLVNLGSQQETFAPLFAIQSTQQSNAGVANSLGSQFNGGTGDTSLTLPQHLPINPTQLHNKTRRLILC